MGLCVPVCAKTQQERLGRDAYGWRNKIVLLLHILALQHESTNIVNIRETKQLCTISPEYWASVLPFLWTMFHCWGRFIEGETCNLKSSTTHPQVMRYGHHDTRWYDVKLTSHMYLSPKKVSIIAELVEDKFWLVVWNIFVFSIYWEFHDPNWLIFFRGIQTTNQNFTERSCEIFWFFLVKTYKSSDMLIAWE